MKLGSMIFLPKDKIRLGNFGEALALTFPESVVLMAHSHPFAQGPFKAPVPS